MIVRSMHRGFCLSFLAVMLLSGCGDGCGGAKPTADGGSPAPTEAPTPPADALLAGVAALAARVPGLPPAGADGGVLADREVFRRDALTLGGQAIDEARVDVAIALAQVLADAGELNSAGAYLQRAVGLLPPATAGKAHMLLLAEVKLQQGKALEGASLVERAVDVEPLADVEFAALSRMYLGAGRPGPARAATTRGLRVVPESVLLQVQAAEVELVTNGAPTALGRLPADAEGALGERMLALRAEAKLVSGDVPGALADAQALMARAASSPLGPLLVAAAGGAGRDDLLTRAASLVPVGLDGEDARRMTAWVQAADFSAPYSRLVPESTEAVPGGVAVVPTPAGAAAPPLPGSPKGNEPTASAP